MLELIILLIFRCISRTNKTGKGDQAGGAARVGSSEEYVYDILPCLCCYPASKQD